MKYKVQAGALQFVLFIGVVIAMLLLTFVTLSYTHSFFGKKTERLIDTVKYADLGLAYAMQANLELNDTINLKLGLEEDITLKGIKSYWGVFEKYLITASTVKNSFSKSALVGLGIDQGIPALYLTDHDRPLVVVGKTYINGEAYLPKQGVKSGNISGNSYYSDRLIYGKQHISRAALPGIDPILKTQLLRSTQDRFSEISGEQLISISNNAPLSNSFLASTQYIRGNVLRLSGVNLTGNIIVIASHKIVVDASSSLQDVVLIAPEIDIQNGVKGRFQCIASKTIQLGKHCELQYPSALIVYEKNNANTTPTPSIFLDKNSSISGIVMYLGKQKKPRFYPQIKIAEDAIVLGELYCEENLELLGEVRGSVTTNTFMTREKGTIYQNHLYNAVINSDLLSPKYVGLLYKSSSNNKTISKWLY